MAPRLDDNRNNHPWVSESVPRENYDDPTIYSRMSPDGRVHFFHGDGEPVHHPSGDGHTFYRSTPSNDNGLAHNGETYRVNADGTYQRWDVAADKPHAGSEPIVPAGYAKGADGDYRPVDAQGHQIGPPIGTQLASGKIGGFDNKVPEGASIFDPATHAFRPAATGETRPPAEGERFTNHTGGDGGGGAGGGSAAGGAPSAGDGGSGGIPSDHHSEPSIPAGTSPPLRGTSPEELRRQLSEMGISVDSDDPADLARGAAMMMARMPPRAPDRWLPSVDPADPAFGDDPALRARISTLASRVSAADNGFTSANDSSFRVDPALANGYDKAELPIGPDIDGLSGTGTAIRAYRDAVAGPAADLGKYLATTLPAHTEPKVREYAAKTGMHASGTFLTGLGDAAAPEGTLNKLSAAATAAGEEAVNQWHDFRKGVRAARDGFAGAFAPTANGAMALVPGGEDAELPVPAPDPAKITAKAKAADGIFGAPPESVTYKTTSAKGGDAGGGAGPGAAMDPLTGTTGPAGPLPGGTGTPTSPSSAEQLAKLLAAQPGGQQMPPMPQMPGMPGGMPGIPGIPLGGMPGMGDDPVSPMSREADPDRPDTASADTPGAPAHQGEDPSMVGLGPLRPGDAVRPNQLGADGRKLDADGDGLLDDDAVLPGDGDKETPLTLSTADGDIPMTLRDPRLGEMMLNMTQAGSNGEQLSVLDAAARAGVPMPDHGERINPMDIAPGDAVVGKGEGLYVGDAKVLTGDGSVVPLADILELRPPDKGVFRLPLPDDVGYSAAAPEAPAHTPPDFTPAAAPEGPAAPAAAPAYTPASADPPPPAPDPWEIGGVTPPEEAAPEPGAPQRMDFAFTPPT